MERPTFAAIQRNGQRKNKLWRAHCETLQARVAALHPETGGHLGLAHNWGNAAAREAIRRADSRWQRISAALDRRYLELARADVRATGGNPSF